MVASTSASSSDCFIYYGCTNYISGCRSIFITYTEYPLNPKIVNGYNGVTSFASWYGSAGLICQLPAGMTETIILQEVVHLLLSFNLMSQSQIINKDVKVEPVNHSGPNLYTRHDKLIATIPHIDGHFLRDHGLHRAAELTKFTDIGKDSRMLALKMTRHASRYNAEMLMLQHWRWSHISLKALEILPKAVADTLKVTGKCKCESCIKCILARKRNALNTISCSTELMQLVHSDLCGPLETAIRGGPYMLLFIDNATRHTNEYILKYKLKAFEKFAEWKPLREKQSGKQVD